METVLCEDHPDEYVQFVCLPCNQFICRDCKMADHEGHPTKDIRKTAEQARKDMTVMCSQLQTGVHIVRSQLRDAEANLAQFDESVREAESELRGRVETIVKWAEMFHEETLTTLKRVAAEGRKEQEEFIASLHDKDKKLSHFQHDIQETLNSQSDLQVTNTEIHLKNDGPGEALSCSTLLRSAVKYRLQVGFSDNVEFNKHKKEIKEFLGKPVLAQVGKDSPSIAMLSEFRCSKDPDANVMAIHHLENGKVAIAYSNDNRDVHYISVFDVNTKKKLLKEVTSPEHKRSIISKTTSSSLALYPVVSGGAAVKTVNLDMDKLADVDDDRWEKGNTSVFTLKKSKRAAGSYRVFDETASPEETWRGPFKFSVEDPLTICADSNGQHFAIIQIPGLTRSASFTSSAQSKTLRPSVALFRRQQPNRFALFQPANVRGFYPSDICFHLINNKEVLLVADEANNVIYIVDFSAECVQNGRVEKSGELGSGCPWLTSPTALAVDNEGVLWVGCRAGQILRCVPTEHMQTCHQPCNTDEESGYEYPTNVDDSEGSASGGTTASSDRDVNSRSPSLARGSQPGFRQSESDSENSTSGGSFSGANARKNSVPDVSPSQVQSPIGIAARQPNLTGELKQALAFKTNTPTFSPQKEDKTTGYTPMSMPIYDKGALYADNNVSAQGCDQEAWPPPPPPDTQYGGTGSTGPQQLYSGVDASSTANNCNNLPPPRPARRPPPPPPADNPDDSPPLPPLPARPNKLFRHVPTPESADTQTDYLNFQSQIATDACEASREPEEPKNESPIPKPPQAPAEVLKSTSEATTPVSPIPKLSQAPAPTVKSPQEAAGPVPPLPKPTNALAQALKSPQGGVVDELSQKLAARLKKIDSQDESPTSPDAARNVPEQHDGSLPSPQSPLSTGDLHLSGSSQSPEDPPPVPPKPSAKPPPTPRAFAETK